jgi:hypothetical protein
MLIFPSCKNCGERLRKNEIEVCRYCKRKQELFCVKCGVNLRHGRSKYCWECLQEKEYNRDKQYRLKKQI